MKKVKEFKRLSLSLCLKLLYIYARKAVGFKIGDAETVYLAYFFSLIKCDLVHVAEEIDYFEAMNGEGVHLFLRKYPSSDAQVLYQIWKEKEYEVVAEYIKENFSDKSLRIIDAGANVGYASLFLFHELKRHFDLQFIVIEPSKDNIRILKMNFERNGMTRYNVETAGLFNKSCFLKIVTDFRDGKDWSLRVEETTDPSDLRGIEIVDMTRKYDWPSVDFFKIDIEGSEKYLFEDETYARNFLNMIKLLSIEIHKEVDPDCQIEKSLTKNGFDWFRHGEITIGHNRKFKMKTSE
jgi:FkbM family methyltransferase